MLSAASPAPRGDTLLGLFQKDQLLAVRCRKIPYLFREVQAVQEGVVVPLSCVTAYPLCMEKPAIQGPV